MWTSESAYHSPVLAGSTTGLHHPGVGAWSAPPKGRGHLWSALLLLAVGVVTLAVLAVVALAIVLGGMSGHSGGTKSSTSSPPVNVAPSATWGEETEEFYRLPPPRQQLEKIRKTTPAPPVVTSTLPPPPPVSTTVRRVVSTSTSSTTTTTTRPPIVVRTTQRSAIQEVKPPKLSAKDEARRTFSPSSVPAVPPPYQVRHSVDFSRDSSAKPPKEEAWPSESRNHGPIGEAEPVGEAVVSTLQEVVADTSRLPARSYSGVHGVSLRPMPTFFPPGKSEAEVMSTTFKTTTTTTTQVPIEKRLLEVIDSPFFIESLKSLPPTKVTPSVVPELEKDLDDSSKVDFSTEMNHRRGLVEATLRPVPNYHLASTTKEHGELVDRLVEATRQPVPNYHLASTTKEHGELVEATLRPVPNYNLASTTKEPGELVDRLVEATRQPVPNYNLASTKEPGELVEATQRPVLNYHLTSTKEPGELSRVELVALPATTTPPAEPEQNLTTQALPKTTEVPPSTLPPSTTAEEGSSPDDVVSTTETEPEITEATTERPLSIFDINTTNPVVFKPTYFSSTYAENKTQVELIVPPKSEQVTVARPTVGAARPTVGANIKLAPTLEIVVKNSSEFDDTLTLVKSISPVPAEVTTEGTQMTSRAAVPSPTLAGILRPASTGQRTAEVEALGPIKAGLLLREPKSGLPKESSLQAFPKSEFISAPSFLLNQRRNHTGKKPLTSAAASKLPVPTMKPLGNCTCGDRLRAQGLGRKLCDGVVDCWDYSDEENCEWCGPGQYVCAQSRACVAKDKLCDGRRDCPFGDDERMCVSIAPDLEQASSLSYHDDGLLMVQQSGKWGPLCVEKLDGSAWRLGDVARAVCRALTYRDFELAEQVVDPLKMGPYFELNFDRNATRNAPRLAVRSSECPSRAAVRLGCRELQCGVRPLAVSQWARIVGGGNAGPGAWPWQAALYKEGQFQCGGSLVNSQWLLSASHCFAHNLEAYWVARLGALRRGTDLASPFEQLRRVVHITQHPGYLDTGFINDLALLRLERPVDFSDYVRPVCLPVPTSTLASESKADESVPEGHMCTVVGWGQLSEVGRIFPDTLQEVQLPLIPTEECRRRTVFLPLYRVTEDMFCAGYDRGGRDACLGDSGGPLMCQRSDGHWELTGITSNGYGCARAHRPGVYTKVANYVHWIADVMRTGSLSESKSSGRAPQCPAGQRRCALGQCVPSSEDRCDRNYCPPPS